ncbi:MAG: hypothetical protein IJT62_05550 [Oscillospiraceae bacterium]|nr:hypothetical protein [Oscillospiraceae bacterium]
MSVASKTVTIPEDLAEGYIKLEKMNAGTGIAYRVVFSFVRSENVLSISTRLDFVGAMILGQEYDEGLGRWYYTAVGSDQTTVTFSVDDWTSSPAIKTNDRITRNTKFVRVGVETVNLENASYAKIGTNDLGSHSISVPEYGDFTVELEIRTSSGSSPATQEWDDAVTVEDRREVNIPVYFRSGDTIKRCRKAYIRDGDTVKQCSVYLRLGGTIRKIG